MSFTSEQRAAGGATTLSRYGIEHYRAIAQGRPRRARYGERRRVVAAVGDTGGGGFGEIEEMLSSVACDATLARLRSRQWGYSPEQAQ